ncbi:outer membrane lipoprotein-sorting protein [Microscilla marina]|uniref:Uncharacterized protein TP-0789 domain-containing protein n=1 Tax=Microscilla marina ATCC 23134 TaxID=313606 RepID=A1ZJG3_MICM2|nr:outer membrane lipoprotein-sorting protein [Microscilla marina]EAY29266.1 hypothetical protein M23134_01320 [Microscilla marina ATCC 23134]
MTKLISSVLLCLGFVIGQAQNADKIVSTHIEKLGGIDQLRAMRARVQKMTVRSQGQNIPMIEYHKRPNRLKIVVQIQGMDFVTSAYDGRQGWKMNPLGMPERMSGYNTRKMGGREFDRLWVDYKKRGHKIAFKGKQRVKGQDCYKLLVTKKDGQQVAFCIATQSYMILKVESIREETGTKVTRYYTDYKKVGGVMFAHKITGVTEGTKFDITIKSIKINEPINDKLFAYPGDN